MGFRTSTASGDCCTPALPRGDLPITDVIARGQVATTDSGFRISSLSRADEPGQLAGSGSSQRVCWPGPGQRLLPGRGESDDGDFCTQTEANREIISQAFGAWQRGTGAVSDVFAPEMVWRIEGHSAASREYHSRRQFIDEVLAPFGARFSTSEPFRPVTIRGVFADGDTVIVVWDGRGITIDDQPYENSYAWIMKMHAGQVVDGTAFYDSISFNSLWTRVQPR